MKTINKQKSEYLFTNENNILAENNLTKSYNFPILQKNFSSFLNYDLDAYKYDLTNFGLKETWRRICDYVLTKPNNIPEFLNPKNFGELYEIGLAHQDKDLKKQSGQYYTPADVATVMSVWLSEIDAANICDVGCGTGNLILTYLNLLKKTEAIKLIKEGKLHLYDFDETALLICKTSIAFFFGVELFDLINAHHCDFLDKKIELPKNSKVISNPPYAQIKTISENWDQTKVLIDTKEFYSSFMEKIYTESLGAVVISPFSFLSGTKYFSLRDLMCKKGNGFIVNFDNVPGNIFKGRKHGTFNTNTANSVRASITVFNKSKELKGFRISPLIRFKNSERNKIINADLLSSVLPENLQVVNKNNTKFQKVSKELTSVFKHYTEKSKFQLKDFLSDKPTKYLINVPNTCRYFTTASSKELSRNGSIKLYFTDPRIHDFVYCLINSSFAYWWWRIFDGGITYPVNLLKSLPIPFNLLNENDFSWFKETASFLKENEAKFVIKKMNAGTVQENIKFPKEIRKQINEKILKLLGFEKEHEEEFKRIHANCFFICETTDSL